MTQPQLQASSHLASKSLIFLPHLLFFCRKVGQQRGKEKKKKKKRSGSIARIYIAEEKSPIGGKDTQTPPMDHHQAASRSIQLMQQRWRKKKKEKEKTNKFSKHGAGSSLPSVCEVVHIPAAAVTVHVSRCSPGSQGARIWGKKMPAYWPQNQLQQTFQTLGAASRLSSIIWRPPPLLFFPTGFKTFTTHKQCGGLDRYSLSLPFFRV